MNNQSYRVNTRPTRVGEPKGSYTVHVIGRCGVFERKPENWQTFSGDSALEAYATAKHLGACGNCWPDLEERRKQNQQFAALFSA